MGKSTLILLLILFFICLIPLSIQAQNKRKPKKDDGYTTSRKILEPIPFHLSSLGSLKFYGLKFGIDYPFKMTEIRGFLNGTQGERTMIERYVSADVGIWHFNGIHENVFFSTEFTLRFINSSGYYFQLSPLGVGVNYLMPSFVKNHIIQDSVPANNKVYITPSVSMGVGRDFSFRRAGKRLPLMVYLKGGVCSMFPFKKIGYIFPTAEAGLAVRFNGINVFVKKERRN